MARQQEQTRELNTCMAYLKSCTGPDASFMWFAEQMMGHSGFILVIPSIMVIMVIMWIRCFIVDDSNPKIRKAFILNHDDTIAFCCRLGPSTRLGKDSWYQALDAYTCWDYNESITHSGSYWIKHEALETILTVWLLSLGFLGYHYSWMIGFPSWDSSSS